MVISDIFHQKDIRQCSDFRGVRIWNRDCVDGTCRPVLSLYWL